MSEIIELKNGYYTKASDGSVNLTCSMPKQFSPEKVVAMFLKHTNMRADMTRPKISHFTYDVYEITEKLLVPVSDNVLKMLYLKLTGKPTKKEIEKKTLLPMATMDQTPDISKIVPSMTSKFHKREYSINFHVR